MRKVVSRTSASTDLKGIGIATRKAWGNEQARRYVAELRRGIKSLSEFSERFVEVVRILHDAMDFNER